MKVNMKLSGFTAALLLAASTQSFAAGLTVTGYGDVSGGQAGAVVTGVATVTDRTSLLSNTYTSTFDGNDVQLADYAESTIDNGVYELKFTLTQSVKVDALSVDSIAILDSILYYDSSAQKGYLAVMDCVVPDGKQNICGFTKVGQTREISGLLDTAEDGMGSIVFDANDPLQFTTKVPDLVNSIQTINFTVTDAASEVPVPAAAWLFGSAIIGLAGLKKRK